MALCGVAETPQINCHSWPFLSFFFSLFPPLPNSFFPFFSVVHNWGPLYGLIKQYPPPPTGLLHFWRHFMRNACPCLNVLIALIDIPVFCPRGLLKSKKFQNIEKSRGTQHCADNPTSKNIWLQTYCSLRDQSNTAWRISAILLPLTVAERNVIWQTNVVTDSLPAGFYGSTVLLVFEPPQQ